MWAIVELMGHNVLAGEVNPSSDFPGLVQINVPATANQTGWTKIVNVSAIYAITPVTEETARLKAEALDGSPVQLYDVRQMIYAKLNAESEALLQDTIQEPETDEPW